MSAAVLEVEDLTVRHGQALAVQGASLRVRAGEVVTVIGPNGAGKSSLLNAIMGLLPAAGPVRFGRCTSRSPLEQRVGAGMSLVPETRELFGSMSVEDNLRLGAWSRRALARERLEDMFTLFPRLRERRAQHAETLSGGERQMLAIARALMSRPSLLMLDEPSLGLAPLVVREIFDRIAQLRREGAAILLVEQNARAALKLADYAYVLENGCIVMEGPAPRLLNDARIARTYLGS